MKMQLNTHPMEEYINALVTCELAMMMAITYKEPVDKAIRGCALIASSKCTNWNNKMVFLGVSKSELPAAMVYHFRTMLDEQLSL